MKNICFPLLAMLLFSCANKATNVKKYYFPYHQFIQPTTYDYVDLNDTSIHMYWYMKTEVRNADTIFGIHIFNSKFQLTNILFNQITLDGVRLKKALFYNNDSLPPASFNISKDEVYNWEISQSDKLFINMHLSDSAETESQEIITEKSFNIKDQKVMYNGKEYKCVVVNEKTAINYILSNTTKTEEQERTSIYAENIGVIKMETHTINGSSVMVLQRIMNLKDWERLRLNSTLVRPKSVLE